MQYMNKTFMGAQRIYVEFAERYGGSRLPRAWSKYTQGTSRYNKLHATDDGVAEKRVGVRELKKLRKKEREGQDPKEGASLIVLMLECLTTSAVQPRPSDRDAIPSIAFAWVWLQSRKVVTCCQVSVA